MFHRHKPLKERLNEALYRLKAQSEKLDQTVSRLQQRDKEIFDKCVAAEAARDNVHAIIYANECAEVRKMAQVIIRCQLALEEVTLRLETVEELGDVMVQMSPIIGIVRETKKQLTGVIPEVAYELDEVNGVLDTTLTDVGSVSAEPANIEASNAEAKKVLDEANTISEQRIKEKFPELPPTVAIPESPKPAKEALAATAYATSKSVMADTDSTQILVDQKVYGYIKSHGHTLDINKCASELNVKPEAIYDAVEALKKSGKITIG